VTRFELDNLSWLELDLVIVCVNFDGPLRWIPASQLDDLFGSYSGLTPLVNRAFNVDKELFAAFCFRFNNLHGNPPFSPFRRQLGNAEISGVLEIEQNVLFANRALGSVYEC
jgi:hypothetical protein